MDKKALAGLNRKGGTVAAMLGGHNNFMVFLLIYPARMSIIIR